MSDRADERQDDLIGFGRMHKSICEFPSETLYGSRLRCHPSVEQHLLRDIPGTKDEEDFVDVLSTPVVFFDTAGCEYYERLDDEGGAGDEGSRRNENEATVVRNWVEKLVSAGSLVRVALVADEGPTKGGSRIGAGSDRSHHPVSQTTPSLGRIE